VTAPRESYVDTEVMAAILRAAKLLGLRFESPLLDREPAPGTKISTNQLYEYWRALGSDGTLTLATRIADSLEPGQLGLLEYVISNAPLVGVALHHLTRHLDYSYKGAQLDLLVRDQVATLHYQSPNIIDGAAEWTVAFAHTRMGAMVGDDWQVDEVRFQFEAPEDSSRYQAHFGCPVKFSQSATALVFAEKFLSYKVLTAQASLYRVLCRQLERELYERRSKSLSFEDRVQATLEDNLREGETTREQLATKMQMPLSELGESLSKQGFETFAAYLDSVRRELAVRWLTYENKSMSDVAMDLGYASNSTLTRACQRWFGMSPSAFRRSNR
jgi:AraC-like DNA-binding protein